MKIRFMLHDAYDEGGGVLTVTLALAAELAKRHDVELISVFGHPPPIHPHPPEVTVRRLQSGWVGLASKLPRNRRLARQPSELVPAVESRYDYYSAWTDVLLERWLRGLRGGALVTMQPALSIAAARVAPQGCVVVAQEHRPFDRRARQIRRAYRRSAAGLSFFLTLTQGDARQYRAWLGRRVPVRAMPNGMPVHTGPTSGQDSQLVVAAGRLAYSKGFDRLIEAWTRVAAACPDWQLEIWGEGDLEPELRRQIRTAGLTGRVHLRGFSTQLQRELARASIFVLSSRAEGYPRVIQEAMACSLPVVSTDCPSGPREMISDGVDGRLVPDDDDALAQAIIDLIEAGPEYRRAMGVAAQARVREMGQDVIARRWEQLLLQLDQERTSRQGARR